MSDILSLQFLEYQQSAVPAAVNIEVHSDDESDSGYETPPEYFITPLVEACNRKTKESWQMEGFVVEEQSVHGLETLKVCLYTIPFFKIGSLQLIFFLLSLQLVDLDGKVTSLADVLRGRRVLLIFMRHFGCIFCEFISKN